MTGYPGASRGEVGYAVHGRVGMPVGISQVDAEGREWWNFPGLPGYRCVERGMFVHSFNSVWSFCARTTSVNIFRDGLEKRYSCSRNCSDDRRMIHGTHLLYARGGYQLCALALLSDQSNPPFQRDAFKHFCNHLFSQISAALR